MAIEFIDGWDHYTTGFNRKWDASGGANIIQPGRFGGNAVGPDAGGFRKMLSGNLATVVCGFAYQRSSFAAFGIASFQDGGSVGALGSNQVDLRVTATGALTVTRNGTVLGTSTSVLLSGGVWQYIEWKVTIGSAGSYEVHVNGINVLSGSGNTQNTTNAFVNQVALNIVAGDNGRGNNYDDFYCLNTAGTINNDFLGECRVATSLPTGDGVTTQWTPSAGTSHFANVDDPSTPNDDTDYNSSSTVGQIDLLTFPSLVTSASVAAVQTVMCVRKDDVGARSIAEQCKSGSTTFSGANQTVGSSYAMLREIREIDPNTGSAWTLTNMNAAQFGIKVIA